MYKIKERNQNEFVISKSRFIGIAIPLDDETKVKEILKDITKEFPKATHYCYAYRINQKEKSCDDGEPSGTAGRPMLEYLTKIEVENVFVIAIRYFGGIKLGAGGLLRAYVDTAKCAFENAKLYKIEYHTEFQIEMDYKYYDYIRDYLYTKNGKIEDTLFEETVTIFYLGDSLSYEDLNSITNGNIKISQNGTKEVYIEKKEA